MINRIFRHIFSGSLGIDVLRNLYTGIVTGNKNYYPFAAIEGIAAVAIEVGGYLEDKRRAIINHFCKETAPQLIEESKRLYYRGFSLTELIDGKINRHRRIKWD